LDETARLRTNSPKYVLTEFGKYQFSVRKGRAILGTSKNEIPGLGVDPPKEPKPLKQIPALVKDGVVKNVWVNRTVD